MKCSRCGSLRTEAKIISVDKKRRNTIYFMTPFLLTVIAFAAVGYIANSFFQALYGGFVIGGVAGIIGSIVSRILPQQHKVVFVCNDCGQITKAK